MVSPEDIPDSETQTISVIDTTSIISNASNSDVQDQERLDIIIRRLNIDFGVDVVVTHPNTVAKCQVGIKTLSQPVRAATKSAQAKLTRYAQLIDITKHRMKFYPFACESYGALSKSALDLISDMSLDSTDPQSFKQHLLNVVSVALQRGNAFILQKGISRTRSKKPFRAAMVDALA